MKHLLYSSLLICVFLLYLPFAVTGWGQEQAIRPANPSQGLEASFPSMGTLVRLTAYGEPDSIEGAFAAVEQKIAELAAVLTDYDPHSETRQLPGKAFQRPVQVSAPLWDVLVAADEWFQRSAGSLDCSLGNLTHLWRKHRRAGRVPSGSDIVHALAHSGWKSVHLDRNARTVTMAAATVRLDFGAIGKGYVVDQAFQLLCQHGIHCCLVDIGGNMRCGDAPPNKSGWRIALAPVDDLAKDGSTTENSSAPLATISIVNQAIATSGDLWQFTVVDGIKRSHIIDPQTGIGISGPLAVTAIASTALDADALSTIGCLCSWEMFQALVSSIDQAAAMRTSRIEDEEMVTRTELFPQISYP